MNLSNLGEAGLIDRIQKRFPMSSTPGLVGIGDDCAVIPQSKENSLLVSTDTLVEDVHFLRRAIAAADLGHKSLAVNLSDIAAMGGQPKSVFLSLSLPSNLEISWMDSFLDGFSALAKECGVELLGGDTTRSPNLIFINVTILGEAHPSQVKLRSCARPGDFLCVTGNLGDSGAGLKAILEESPKDAQVQRLIEQHHRPRPHLREGAWLAQHSAVHAMMDVSDGLHSDVRRMIRASRCGAQIHMEQLPMSAELKDVSKRLHWDFHALATSAGEDYCLLVSVSSKDFEKLNQEYSAKFQTSLHVIGEIHDRKDELVYSLHRKPYELKPITFDHF